MPPKPPIGILLKASLWFSPYFEYYSTKYALARILGVVSKIC